MAISRVTPTTDLVRSATEHIAYYLTSELQGRIDTTHRYVDQLAALVAPIRVLVQQDEKASVALENLRQLAQKERSVQQSNVSMKPTLKGQRFLTINPGVQIIVPPYDVEWTTPSHPAEWAPDKAKGIFQTLSFENMDPPQAGLGVFLAADQPTFVRVSPDMEYHYRWDYNIVEGAAMTEGEAGMFVMKVSEPGDRVDRRAQLFHQEGVFPSPFAMGEDDSFLTTTSAGEIYRTMDAKSTYLVFVWCRSHTVVSLPPADEPYRATANATADIRCHMPFIVVEGSAY